MSAGAVALEEAVGPARSAAPDRAFLAAAALLFAGSAAVTVASS